jgi:DNA topoisomerase IA
MKKTTAPPQANAQQVPSAGYPYTLADLQQVAQEKFGLEPKVVYQTAVSLYERGLITYPYTSSRALPEHLFAENAKLVENYVWVTKDRAFDPTVKAPAWTADFKDAHHGILVTAMPAVALFGSDTWSESDTQVYGLIHARFLSLFKRT